MRRMTWERKEPDVCESCTETALYSGFGNLEQYAAMVAKQNGDRFEPHECEYPECECSCIHEFDRQQWQELENQGKALR